MSLGEIVLVLIVGIIVVGPKKLPSMMRTAGQWVAKLRRMTTDLRSQSGIDDILRKEGLDEHIHQLRSLSRLNVVDSLIAPAVGATTSPYPAPPPAAPKAKPAAAPQPSWDRAEPLRGREYPLIGCDAAGALPDDAVTYRNPLPDRQPAQEEDPPAAAPEAQADKPAEASADKPAEASADKPAEASADKPAEEAAS